MHGPGYAPPQPPRPSTTLVVVLSVLFVALSVLSIGFLAWAAMLRVACVTRARRDWFLFGVSLAVLVAACVLIENDPTDDLSTPSGNIAAVLLLLSALGSAGYLLYVDVRRLQAPPAGPAAPTVTYGYPPSVAPQGYAPTPAPYVPPQPAPYAPPQPTPFGTTPVPAPPPTPAPTPQPQRPAPARIDQVRAELDELSDFLRGQDQGKDRGTGGGR